MIGVQFLAWAMMGFRQALGPTQPPIQWIPEALPELELQGS